MGGIGGMGGTGRGSTQDHAAPGMPQCGPVHSTVAPMLPQVPDYMVFGPELAWKGMGGILAAGFYGSNWEWRPDTAYATC